MPAKKGKGTEEELGILDVIVLSAKGLQRMDIRGLSDPYCILTLVNEDGKGGKKKFQTKHIRQTLSPEWNYECSFEVEQPSQMLIVKMYDHDTIGLDDLMGFVKIPVADAMLRDIVDWFFLLSEEGEKIIGEDGTNSVVRLSLKYTEHTSKDKQVKYLGVYEGSVGEKDLRRAVKQAAGCSPKKRVLLQLGATWSISCKKMYHVLTQDPVCVEAIEKFYIYIRLDAENEENFEVLKKLGDPQWMGFPVFVLLDYQGRYIHTQPTGALEIEPILTADEPDPEKVAKFLAFWREGGPNDHEKDTPV